MRVTEDWLLAGARLRESDYALVSRAIDALQPRSEGASVRATCERLGLSNKHLIELFRALVGLPPKTWRGSSAFTVRWPIWRHRRRPAASSSRSNWDQSHFNNEFRRFAGATPGEFAARRGEDNETLIVG